MIPPMASYCMAEEEGTRASIKRKKMNKQKQKKPWIKPLINSQWKTRVLSGIDEKNQRVVAIPIVEMLPILSKCTSFYYKRDHISAPEGVICTQRLIPTIHDS
ncbi:UNVERIFIED_CONTAM: hypothetical protein K2H54_058004 [Gekko kuhli]